MIQRWNEADRLRAGCDKLPNGNALEVQKEVSLEEEYH
jgi:hypothetical protein